MCVGAVQSAQCKHQKINGWRSNTLNCLFVFQGSFLWGGPSWGKEVQEIGGHQVYPQEGIRGQRKQHREWDRRPAQVSGLLIDHTEASLCNDYKPLYVRWSASEILATRKVQDCKFFITVSITVSCQLYHITTYHILSLWYVLW